MEEDKIGHKLVTWYKNNHRKLPWRYTSDPYKIWLSEIILQQTRINQGLPYYERFITQYPDIESLARASETDVLRLWQGLGYYSRARNMHATARYIVEELKGKFPSRYTDLVKLKGIGDYTASAIASFAFQEQTAVVDGNVFRVLARYYGVTKDISDSDARKTFKELAFASMPTGQAPVFNQAIMEFGALQCTPASPDCTNCILNNSCYAFAHKAQHAFPVKTKKTKIKERSLHYLVLRNGENIALKERKEKDIWKGLYDFYSFEGAFPPNFRQLLPPPYNHLIPKLSAGPIKHILSHQLLSLYFWELNLAQPITIFEELDWYTREEISGLPKPQPIHIYLQEIL